MESLARKIGVSPAHIRNIEMGNQVGSLSIRLKIADALGLKRADLMSESELKEFPELVRKRKKQ